MVKQTKVTRKLNFWIYLNLFKGNT